MKTTFTIILTLLFVFNSFAQCTDKQADYFFEFEGSTYQIAFVHLSWADAAACAEQDGGYLAEINSQAEQDTIYNALLASGIESDYVDVLDGGGIAYVWIGGNDIAEEGTWVWNGNNDDESTHFFTGTWQEWEVIDEQFIFWGGASEGNVDEPDNSGNQDGLGLALEDWPFGKAGEWNDIRDSNELYFIIERDAMDPPTNTVGITNATSIELFPNPAKNHFSIKTGTESVNQLNIYNSFGQQMVLETLNRNTFNTSSFASGVYLVEVLFENGTKNIQKLIID